MLWHRAVTSVKPVITALLLAAAALGLSSAPATAASRTQTHTQRAQVVFSPPQEGDKITLSETSIGGPALWSLPDATPRVILAWTGTDPAHHVNVSTGTDGFYYGAKRILPETSPYRPAVTFSSGGRAGFIVVAWTGTDAAHTVNVEYLDAGTLATVRKLTFWGNSSTSAPGVAVYGAGELAVSWTDSAQGINILRLSPQGQVLGQARLEQLFASADGPNLSYDPGAGQLILAKIEPAQFASVLFFSTSTDAVQWTSERYINETSAFSPSMVGIKAINMPTHWLAWTGTDAGHRLNVQYTESFPDWANVNSKTTLGETAFGPPALGYIGTERQMLVAWTGTDPAHHLNVAVVFVRS